jgi:hypothetical protein
MNALAKSTVSSQHVAASILKDARNAAIKLDEQKLDREKSLLIRNINHSLNDENFYDQHVNEYRTFATIQMLLNEWRSSDKDIMQTGQFEDHVMTHLVTPKDPPQDSTITEDTAGSARLLMKIMSKKLNEKYNGILNDQQKSLIKAYAYATASDDQTSLKKKLQTIKEELIHLIESDESIDDNQYVKNKLVETKNALLSENFEEVNDETVTRFMLYSRLKDELESKE